MSSGYRHYENTQRLSVASETASATPGSPPPGRRRSASVTKRAHSTARTLPGQVGRTNAADRRKVLGVFRRVTEEIKRCIRPGCLGTVEWHAIYLRRRGTAMGRSCVEAIATARCAPEHVPSAAINSGSRRRR
jgi:hypothetical protein